MQRVTDHRDTGSQRDGHQADASTEQVQVEEEQDEDEIRGLRGECQFDQPHRGEYGQPHQRTPTIAHHETAREIDREPDRSDDRRRDVGRSRDQRAHDHHHGQRDGEQVQTPPQRSDNGGEWGRVHVVQR
ncbi:Uncharacterised protein [Mycobacteroides abscessus subsp. abscessus]|nr:Uncharacterised protein [Mycobacteroides abscessus subsp. abscessus]